MPTVGSPAPYAASRTRSRRTEAELGAIYEAIVAAVTADRPMTLRQVFYRLVVTGLVPKTEAEYEKVGRYLLKLRREGTVPYDWIADNTRWMRKPRTYADGAEALRRTAAAYRRALWDDQDAYVEVWLEKEALAGVVVGVTDAWDVPLMVCRGFASESYLYNAAEAIRAAGRPAHLYLLTDRDPSGVAIADHVARRVAGFLPAGAVAVERVAVTEAQIAAWNLPTRPTKATDSRSKGFVGGSVELDAIPAGELRALVEGCIARHIDEDALDRTLAVERLERETLAGIAAGWAA